MPDLYPKDSVLVPQWKRVEDGLPEDGQEVTFVVKGHIGRSIANGYYHESYVDQVTGATFGGFSADGGDTFRSTITHWSPRVGIPLPEEE